MKGINFLSRYSRRSVSDYGCRHLLFFVVFFLYAGSMLNSIYRYSPEERISIGIVSLTLIGFLLSIGVILKKYWHDSIINLYPLFWHITVIYCFGFLGTTYFLTLLTLSPPNDLSTFIIGLLGINFAILILGQLVDRKVFLIGLILSIILGNLVYRVGFYDPQHSPYTMLLDDKFVRTSTLVAIMVNIVLVIFCKGLSKPNISYLDTLLFGLSKELMHYTSNVVGIGKSYGSIISMCIQSSRITKNDEEELVIMSMPKNIFYTLEENLTGLNEVHDIGQELMRYRISALGCKIDKKSFDYYNANDCIREALLSYENVSDLHYKLPSLHVKKDFKFFGSAKHFKQAIMYLLSYSYWRFNKEDEKRHIWVEDNKISYYYTGTPIKKGELLDLFGYPSDPEIFICESKRFGDVALLYYVRKVMEAFGGDITCKSNIKKGVGYTCFTLTFPKLNKNDKAASNKNNSTTTRPRT